MKTKTVYSISGFNFLPNPFKAGTHLCDSLSGVYRLETPEEGEAFKHALVKRATKEESVYYRSRLPVIPWGGWGWDYEDEM